MTRNGTAYRSLLSSASPPDYALVATLRLVLPGDDRLPREGLRTVRTAPGYLPRWRAGAHRRRERGR